MSNTTKLIRAKVTDKEWQKVRERAVKSQVPPSQWVGDAIRDALLKGAKP